MALDPKAVATQADNIFQKFAKLVAAHPKTAIAVAVAVVIAAIILF